MKLVRITEDRYILDAGDANLTPHHVDEIRRYWAEWWEKIPGEIPEFIVISGTKFPLVYEDHRESDIEQRLQALEAHYHVTNLDRSGPPRGP